MSRVAEPTQLRHSDVAFDLSDAELLAERASGGSTVLRFRAKGQRRNGDGSYVIERVAAVLLRQDASLVRVQRYHESSKPLVVGDKISWSHDLYDAELAGAAAVFYVVETRLQVFRTLLRCELGPADLLAESATWPIVARHVEHSDLVHVDVALSTRRGERVDISLTAESDVINRGHSVAAEFYLLDGAGIALTSAAVSGSLVNGFACEKTDTGIDRATARDIRSIEVRGRVEVTVVSEIGPVTIPAGCRIV